MLTSMSSIVAFMKYSSYTVLYMTHTLLQGTDKMVCLLFLSAHFFFLLLAQFSLSHPDMSVNLGMWHTVSWTVSVPTQTVFLAVDSVTVNKSVNNLVAPPFVSDIPTISLGGANFETLRDEGEMMFGIFDSFCHFRIY